MCEIEKSLCEIGKSLREITKSLYEKLKLLYENEKMSCEIIRYQSRMKNCHVRSILTVDNEKSLCEKKKSPFEIFRAGETYPVSGEYFGGIFPYPAVSREF